MSLQQSQSRSNTSELFLRIQQLQAQQAIIPNPAYQPPAQQAITPNPAYQPPPPSAPAPFNHVFVPYLPDTSLTQPLSSNLFSPSAPRNLFGSFAISNSAVTPTFRIEPSNEQPDYYPASPSVDPERTLKEFEPFLKLPTEVLGMVVEQCVLQDGVCLSLASKDLYTIARPILLRRDKEAFSLSRMSKYECRHFASKSLGHKSCTHRSCRSSHRNRGGHCVVCASCPLFVRLSNNNWSGLPSNKFAYCAYNAVRWEWLSDEKFSGGAVPFRAGTILGWKYPYVGSLS